MKRFHVTGNCVREKHYMVDTTEKINTIIRDYIEQGSYFMINQARQYGKTTTLYLLEEKLRGKYIVLHLSFESADDYFSSSLNLAEGLIMDISDALVRQDIPSVILDEWNRPFSERFPMRALGKKISSLCRECPKEIVLMIDEVDKSSDNQIFLSFLSVLREKYQKQLAGQDSTFKSVILAGVYDIRNLKLKLHPGEESKNNSPWNIAADFMVDMGFSVSDIAGMLAEYEKDVHTKMDILKIAGLIYDYTSGYPFLVSRICKIMDENISGKEGFPDLVSVWTKEGFLEAVKILLTESNTLFDDMVKKLNDFPELRQALYRILFQGEKIPYNIYNYAINLGFMFGFIKKNVKDESAAISNRIFETQLYNLFMSEELLNSSIYKAASVDKDRNRFIRDGKLDMEQVLERFVEAFTDIYSDADEKFVEENGRRFFLLYLKPIINGVGNYYVEARTRNMRRTDVVIDYRGQQIVCELKIWHGNEYNKRGEDQLMDYMDAFHLTTGYMLSFNFNKKKQIGVQRIRIGNKLLIEAVV